MAETEFRLLKRPYLEFAHQNYAIKFDDQNRPNRQNICLFHSILSRPPRFRDVIFPREAWPDCRIISLSLHNLESCGGPLKTLVRSRDNVTNKMGHFSAPINLCNISYSRTLAHLFSVYGPRSNSPFINIPNQFCNL